MLSAAHDILKEEQGGDKNNGTANTTVSRSLHDIAISVTFTGLKKERRDYLILHQTNHVWFILLLYCHHP